MKSSYVLERVEMMSDNSIICTGSDTAPTLYIAVGVVEEDETRAAPSSVQQKQFIRLQQVE